MEIIPGILEKQWIEIERKIELAKPFAKTIHIDIIDGKFAPNTTFLDPGPFAKYTFPSSGHALFFEVHLMVEEPINYLKPFSDVGFRRFLGHIEKMSDQIEFVAQGELLGEVGLAIDASTSIDAIEAPLEDLDCVSIMTVKAGFSEQEFIRNSIDKIKSIRSKTQIPIEVDGGINDQAIVDAVKAGANRFVANSFIFKNDNPSKNYQILNSCLGIKHF
jgi:ribulose-phosphate 3-epimerase